MIKIALTQGKIAIIDDEDLDLIKKYNWHASRNRKNWYAVATVATVPNTLIMHRLILDAKPGSVIDHKDGNGLNNQKNNLRFVTVSQNQFNSRKRDKCTSRFKGVTWIKDRNCWCSQIQNNYKHRHIGFFKDELSAARAYDRMAIKLFGEYAKINFSFHDLEKNHDYDLSQKIIGHYSSKFFGVSRMKNKWRARIMINKKEKYIGCYDTEQEAALAYNVVATKLFGKNAKINNLPH